MPWKVKFISMSIYRYPGPFGWKDDAIAQAFFITKEEEPKDQADIINLTVSITHAVENHETNVVTSVRTEVVTSQTS